jgi:predicted TIM-barrel fold metal-dependent hydrolase
MGLVDVHAHYLPPVYREALAAAGIDRPDGMPAVPDWSAGAHVALMDRLGIDTALLSVSSPGVRFGDGVGASDAVALARAVNDVGAATAREHPGRFGVFASLPLPDLDASIAEVERALDGLGLDGVVLMTNVDGVYLGDPSLEPLMAELDRRGAVAFVHPTSPPCAAAVSLGLPRPLLEFPFDSTRAVTNLLFGGTLARHRRVRWIVPHAGGTLPFLARRLDRRAADDRRRRPGAVRQRLAVHPGGGGGDRARLDRGRREPGGRGAAAGERRGAVPASARGRVALPRRYWPKSVITARPT